MEYPVVEEMRRARDEIGSIRTALMLHRQETSYRLRNIELALSDMRKAKAKKSIDISLPSKVQIVMILIGLAYLGGASMKDILGLIVKSLLH